MIELSKIFAENFFVTLLNGDSTTTASQQKLQPPNAQPAIFTKSGVHVRHDWRILIYRNSCHGFCKVLFFKIPKNFLQSIGAIPFAQVAVTLLNMTCLEYRVYRTLTVISIVQETMFMFECRYQCRWRGADNEIGEWVVIECKRFHFCLLFMEHPPHQWERNSWRVVSVN